LVAERLKPAGTLFTTHTTPHGLEGLYSIRNLSTTDGSFTPDAGGWSRTIIEGNNLVIDVAFYFDPVVQRFLELVLASQYHYRFRWNEQSVLAMIWHVFVPAEHFTVLPFTGYKHPHKNWRC
jgi:hypothetical protein